jgi:hypothetical protein
LLVRVSPSFPVLVIVAEFNHGKFCLTPFVFDFDSSSSSFSFLFLSGYYVIGRPFACCLRSTLTWDCMAFGTALQSRIRRSWVWFNPRCDDVNTEYEMYWALLDHWKPASQHANRGPAEMLTMSGR